MINVMTYPAGMMEMINDDGAWSKKSEENKGDK